MPARRSRPALACALAATLAAALPLCGDGWATSPARGLRRPASSSAALAAAPPPRGDDAGVEPSAGGRGPHRRASPAGAPFSPNSFTVLRVGDTTFDPAGRKLAVPTFLDEYALDGGGLIASRSLPHNATPGADASVACYSTADSSSPLGGPFCATLDLADEREGDLTLSRDGCFLALLAYNYSAGSAVANSPCPCAKTLVAVLVAGDDGSVDASTSFDFVGNAGGGPGYSRPNGALVRPNASAGRRDGHELYALVGEAAGGALVLLRAGERAPRAEVARGFGAPRGLGVAGVEEDRLQLYVNSADWVGEVGEGLPGGPVGPGGIKRVITHNWTADDLGPGFVFENDTALWIIDEEPDTLDRSLLRYVCVEGAGGAAAPCPDGGAWAVDAGPGGRHACVLDGVEVSLWFFALVSGGAAPVFVATTHALAGSDAGANVVVRLYGGTGVCEVLVPPAPNVVYRGVALSPSAAACAAAGGASPSPTRAPPSTTRSSSATATGTPTATGTGTVSHTRSATGTRTPTQTASPSALPGGGAAGAAAGAGALPPAAAAGASVALLAGVAALGAAAALRGHLGEGAQAATRAWGARAAAALAGGAGGVPAGERTTLLSAAQRDLAARRAQSLQAGGSTTTG